MIVQIRSSSTVSGHYNEDVTFKPCGTNSRGGYFSVCTGANMDGLVQGPSH